MFLKKIKYNSAQFFLIFLLLFTIATVFCTCIGFSMELQTYATERFSDKYCPDVYVYSLNNMDLEENFSDKVLMENVKSIGALKGKYVSVPVTHDSVNISSITNMLCVLEDRTFLQYMQVTAGTIEDGTPDLDEIWIVKTLADSYDIEIGDVLYITYQEPIKLTVTAIYSATFAPSERLTIMPNIVNSETITLLNGEPDTGVWALELYDNNEDYVNLLAMSNPYALLTFSREKLSAYVTDISGVVGNVSGIAALIVFLAALFVIRLIIQSQLQRELTLIGIYKAVGYSLDSIISLYIKGYLTIGMASVVLGAATSLPLIYFLGKSTSEALGGFKLSSTTFVMCALAIILLLFLLWCGARIALKRVKTITPVEAIAIGRAFREGKQSDSVIKQAKSPLVMAINDIFKHKQASVITLLVLTISLFLILFFSSSYYTCRHIYDQANIWLACPKFNAIITGDLNDEIIQAARKNGHTKSVVSGDFFYYPPVIIPQYYGNARAIEFVVLDDAREESTGIRMKEGGNPIQVDEIAVSQLLLQELGMQLQDTLTIGMGEQAQSYKISGSFASMEGRAIIMTVDGMKQINPKYYQDNCFIVLKDETQFTALQNDIESIYSGVVVQKEWTALKTAISAIEDMLSSVMRVMLIIFVIFSTISIVNILALTVRNRHKQYGILKSLGFNTAYLITQNLLHILIFLLIAVGLAVIIHITVSEQIFAELVIDAMITSDLLSGLLILFTVLLVLLLSFCICFQIRKITPVDLMEE
jgi:putative ABC transport system permease protein